MLRGTPLVLGKLSRTLGDRCALAGHLGDVQAFPAEWYDVVRRMEVREIERKLRDGAIEAAMIDRCFVSFQRAVFDRYGTTLPPDTIGIDAGEPVAAVAERAFEAVLARSVHEAS